MKRIREKTPSRKGDLAEYYAVTWLWDKGYEVFKNCGCTGLIDLIARDKEGNLIFIDVKTARRNNGDSMTKTDGLTFLQSRIGVRVLSFNPINRDLRFIKHHKREGQNEET